MKFQSYILVFLFSFVTVNAFALSTSTKKMKPSSHSLRKKPKSSSCGKMNRKACEAFHLVNEVRDDEGLPPLAALQRCTLAAQEHAENMAKQGFFDHDAPEESWRERMARHRLNRAAVAENIAKTPSGPDSAVTLWVNSPGHYRNLTGEKYESAGMGYARGNYVQCFSSRRGQHLQKIQFSR